ncbi:Na+/H+ antiporter subunit E [Nesterenkonia alba]|uniref:Na+/H+ antiporter subunit E n=1 Tax=Nesterenkonia alba TaxID=515814 RepID=UPI0003FEAAAE|nr:Na+/H+ antiporter subunit E [Nesterenkonia alba]
MNGVLLSYGISGVLRAVVFGLLWVALAGFEAEYAAYGVISVAATTALSLQLIPPGPRLSVHRWPARVWFTVLLIGWFLWQSARGGVDVALRAAKPHTDIAPAVVVAPVVLPPGHARHLAMLMMNLMPGSMIQRGPFPTDPPEHHKDDDAGSRSSPAPQSGVHVELHTLALELNPAAQWATLQHRVRRATA